MWKSHLDKGTFLCLSGRICENGDNDDVHVRWGQGKINYIVVYLSTINDVWPVKADID